MAKIDKEKEKRDWWDAKYPYDHATCTFCLTGHINCCSDPDHAPLVKAARKVGSRVLSLDGLNSRPATAVKAFQRLRKQFARFYPKTA